jgi:hypothetical protein
MREDIFQLKRPSQNTPIQIFIVASSPVYQTAAGLAASTYVVNGIQVVSVLVPEREPVTKDFPSPEAGAIIS